MFKINDRVELINSLFDDEDCNPRGVSGTVTKLHDKDDFGEGFYIEVTWDNGHHNLYRDGDLSSFNVPLKDNTTDTSSQAMRFNKDKPELSYILDADVALIGACKVMSFGAIKYDRGNWKKGLPVNEVIDSLLRHLVAYQSGEVLDPESGLPHLDHVTCNALFLATFGERE